MTNPNQTQTNIQTNAKQSELKESDWLENELQDITSTSTFAGERLPSLKFEENKPLLLEIDFSKPFYKWQGFNFNKKEQITKAVIPLLCNNVRMAWWLNIKNPIYKDIVRLGREGQTKIKVVQIGIAQATRYTILKE